MTRADDEKGAATALFATLLVPLRALDDELREPTEEEIKNLRHVIDKLPRTVWIALIVGAAERLTCYTITAPWRRVPLYLSLP